MSDPLPQRTGIVKRDEWMWICDACHAERPVSDHRRCGHCGESTFFGAHRRLGAAVRNLGDVMWRSAPPWLRRLFG